MKCDHPVVVSVCTECGYATDELTKLRAELTAANASLALVAMERNEFRHEAQIWRYDAETSNRAIIAMGDEMTAYLRRLGCFSLANKLEPVVAAARERLASKLATPASPTNGAKP